MLRPNGLPRKYRVWVLAASALAAILALLFLFWGPEETVPPSVPAASAPVPGEMQVFEPGRAVPELTFVDAAGRPVSLADFEGRRVLLNLWATWCAPCIEEMPALDRLQADLGGADFEVVALSLDAKGEGVVLPFYAQQNLKHLAPYYDPANAAMRTLNPGGLPTTLLIDEEGREVGRWIGPVDWDAPEVRERLVAG